MMSPSSPASQGSGLALADFGFGFGFEFFSPAVAGLEVVVLFLGSGGSRIFVEDLVELEVNLRDLSLDLVELVELDLVSLLGLTSLGELEVLGVEVRVLLSLDFGVAAEGMVAVELLFLGLMSLVWFLVPKMGFLLERSGFEAGFSSSPMEMNFFLLRSSDFCSWDSGEEKEREKLSWRKRRKSRRIVGERREAMGRSEVWLLVYQTN